MVNPIESDELGSSVRTKLNTVIDRHNQLPDDEAWITNVPRQTLENTSLNGVDIKGQLAMETGTVISANGNINSDASTAHLFSGTFEVEGEITAWSDIDQSNNANAGLILKDRANANRYRLFINNGVLGIELVV